MSVETENGDQAGVDAKAAEDAALAEALAGYNARGPETAPPAAEPDTTAAQPDTPADAQPEANPADEAGNPPAAPAPATPSELEERLAAFKEEIRASASQYTPEEVRKLHGQIGEMNRKLQQIEKTKADVVVPPPAPSALDAAIAEAELAAEGFPEVAGPLVAALKLAAQQKPAEASAPGLTEEQVAQIAQQAAAKAAQRAAIEALAEEHPDYETVRDTPGFKTWVATKPADYQERLNNTWNPAVVSRGLSEFKESQQAKQKKQGRLAGAITPTGSPAPSAPSQPTEMELAWAGYGPTKPRPVKQR